MNDMPNVPLQPKPPTKQQVVDWLAYETEELVTRRDDTVLPAIKEMVAAHPVIDDNDEDLAGRFAENIQMAKDLIKEAVTAHKQHKEPYLIAGQAVDGWKNGFEATVSRALEPIEAIARDFALRKYNREKAARDAEAARAAEAARIARAQAEEAAKRDLWSKAATDAAAESDRRQAELARSQRAASHVSATTRGDYGAKSVLVRRWKWLLRDITLVPPEYLIVNAANIMIASKRRDPVTNKPTAVIPGIEWVEDLGFGTRT